MKLHLRRHHSGIALIVVLIVIVVLGILAGGFAYTMRVETTLARRASFSSELDWIGRAGVAHGQWILSQACQNEPYDALNQAWAGGTGSACSNEPPGTVQVGNGSFTLKITDMDRYFNINRADEQILAQALTLIGVDAGAMTTVANSILDWRDIDKNPRMSGTESEVYEQQNPPYLAKDGPIDDLSELLLIRGVTPNMYSASHGGKMAPPINRGAGQQSVFEEPTYALHLDELFTPLSGPGVNINTAPAAVLQLLPAIDENVAQAIIQARAGPDGQDGGIDDAPFRNPSEVVMRVPGLPIDPNALARFFTVRSQVFKVEITANIGGTSRDYVAIVRRMGASGKVMNTRILNFYWR